MANKRVKNGTLQEKTSYDSVVLSKKLMDSIVHDYNNPGVGEAVPKTGKLLLENKEEYEKMSHACNPYGDGHACERIADILEKGSYSPWVVK